MDNEVSVAWSGGLLVTYSLAAANRFLASNSPNLDFRDSPSYDIDERGALAVRWRALLQLLPPDADRPFSRRLGTETEVDAVSYGTVKLLPKADRVLVRTSAGLQLFDYRLNPVGAIPGCNAVIGTDQSETLLSASCKDANQIFRLSDGAPVVHRKFGYGHAVSPDGRWVADSSLNSVQLFEAASGKVAWEIDGLLSRFITFLGDGRYLLVDGLASQRVLESATGKVVWTDSLLNPAIRVHASRGAYALLDGSTLYIREPGKSPSPPIRLPFKPNSFELSPDFRILGLWDDKRTVRFLDTGPGLRELGSLRSVDHRKVVFSPSGDSVAVQGDSEVHVLDLRSGRKFRFRPADKLRSIENVIWSDKLGTFAVTTLGRNGIGYEPVMVDMAQVRNRLCEIAVREFTHDEVEGYFDGNGPGLNCSAIEKRTVRNLLAEAVDEERESKDDPGRLKAAIALYEKARNADPDFRRDSTLALARLRSAEDPKGALREYESLVKENPADADAVFGATGILYDQLYTPGRVIELLEVYVSKKPDDPIGLSNLTEGYLGGGRFKDVLDFSGRNAEHLTRPVDRLVIPVFRAAAQQALGNRAAAAIEIGHAVDQGASEKSTQGWVFTGTKHFLSNFPQFKDNHKMWLEVLDSYSGQKPEEMLPALQRLRDNLRGSGR
jgi:tetratricopeptide (TPR) repeat protein